MTDDATPGTGSPDPAQGYEQARDELITVVQQLEAGGLTLEESLALWERGEQLVQVCQRLLEGARDRVSGADADDEGAGSAQ